MHRTEPKLLKSFIGDSFFWPLFFYQRSFLHLGNQGQGVSGVQAEWVPVPVTELFARSQEHLPFEPHYFPSIKPSDVPVPTTLRLSFALACFAYPQCVLRGKRNGAYRKRLPRQSPMIRSRGWRRTGRIEPTLPRKSANQAFSSLWLDKS